MWSLAIGKGKEVSSGRRTHHGANLALGLVVLHLHVGVEELAGAGGTALQVSRALGGAGGGAQLRVKGTLGEGLHAHVRVDVVAVQRGIGGGIQGTQDAHVARRSLELAVLVLVVRVGGGDGDLEAVAPLARVLGRFLVERGAPEHTLDHGRARRLRVAGRVLVGKFSGTSQR